jgi:pyridoxal phosphate enzyme (YggS family)
MSVHTRLGAVREAIDQACADAGRKPDEVKLIAVSKTHPVTSVMDALAAGQLDFGENYAQELRDKAPLLAAVDPPVRWHYIGRIQRNKAKFIGPRAFRVHSLESLAQATALLKHAPNGLDALLAVNIGREPQKSGLLPETLLETAKNLTAVPGCRIHGLMCLPPLSEHPKDSVPYFEEMAHWMQAGRAAGLQWTECSMGMSADFPLAIRYGATWVRVGTAIFGARARPG